MIKFIEAVEEDGIFRYIKTEELVKELLRREAKVVISLPPYHTADVHFSGPITILQLQGDWSDKF